MSDGLDPDTNLGVEWSSFTPLFIFIYSEDLCVEYGFFSLLFIFMYNEETALAAL